MKGEKYKKTILNPSIDSVMIGINTIDISHTRKTFIENNFINSRLLPDAQSQKEKNKVV